MEEEENQRKTRRVSSKKRKEAEQEVETDERGGRAENKDGRGGEPEEDKKSQL